MAERGGGGETGQKRGLGGGGGAAGRKERSGVFGAGGGKPVVAKAPSMAKGEAAKVVAGGRPEVVSPARRAAFRVLLELEKGTVHSDELLHAGGRGAALDGLSEVDRNLTTALVMGVLRWQIALDRRLRALFARPESEVAAEVMVALRMGAFQLLHLDRIPVHAALSESVALVRAAGQEFATGMVNAVLRKIAIGPKAEPAKIYETAAAMGERLGHPGWMAERWAKTYGRAAAGRVCEADQSEPGTTGLLTADERLPVMDEGSRLVAEIAAVGAPEVSGRRLRVWDCCAAPGGKTAVLAVRLAERLLDIEILATDVSGRRLREMEERLGALAVSAGLGGTVRCLVADATALPSAEGSFDLVLCDVPCSGTGTLGRNPEIRLRLAESELGRQAARQREILRAAMERVAEEGRLVYSTCSLEPEECEAVVAAVLAGAVGWRRVPVEGLLEELRASGMLVGVMEDAVREGALRTLPGVQAMDGFYAVVLERGQ